MNSRQRLVAADRALATSYGLLTEAIRAPSQRRHRYFVTALRALAPVCPAYEETSEREREFPSVFEADTEQELARLSATLSACLPFIGPLDYVAASHWSPIDQRRHTVYSTVERHGADALYRTSCAYLFYALTLMGEERREGLLSVTHYTAVRARKKLPVYTCFAEAAPRDGLDWWTVPEEQARLVLQASGIVDKARLLADLWGKERLQKALRSTLENPENGWDRLEGEMDAYLPVFYDKLRAIDSLPGDPAEEARKYFVRRLEAERLSKLDAAFMLVSQCLWREACPTRLMYSFVTDVAETCSFLTCGRSRRLDDAGMIALAFIARSLFLHPLLVEYADRERRKRERDSAHVRALAHEAANLVKAVEAAGQAILYSNGTLNSGDRELLLHMMSNLRDTVLLLKNLASAERISMGEFLPKRDRVDYAQVLRRLVDIRRPLLEAAYGIRLTSDLSEGKGLWLDGDEFLLERAVENVLLNACKFSPRGGTVTLVLRESDGVLETSVTDEGPGIPEEYRHRVFDEFFTIERRKLLAEDGGSHRTGTGLGLYIVREVIRAHKGTVDLLPAKPRGCRVLIRLPSSGCHRELPTAVSDEACKDAHDGKSGEISYEQR